MKTTLDGKQAGLQDAKQLKKELSDLKMKEDTMFAKVGPVNRIIAFIEILSLHINVVT